MGAGDCQWGGYTNRSVCSQVQRFYLFKAVKYRNFLWKYLWMLTTKRTAKKVWFQNPGIRSQFLIFCGIVSLACCNIIACGIGYQDKSQDDYWQWRLVAIPVVATGCR